MQKTLLMFKRTGLVLITFLFINAYSNAATFTAQSSGDWSSSTTWGGGPAPSFTNSSDQITIPSGISVTMDDNATLNGALAELKVNGSLTGSTGKTLAIDNGTLSGSGSITVTNATFGSGAILLFTGTITANTFSAATLALKSGAAIVVKETLTLTSGVLSIETGGTLSVNSGATIVLSGGQLVTNGGTVTLSSGYNVTYMTTGITAGLELTGGSLGNLTINIPSGQKVTLSSDLTVTGTLTLASGTLNLGSSNLTLTGDIAASGTGDVTSTLSSSITIKTTQSITGVLTFSGSSNAVNNLTIDVGSGNHAQINGDLSVNGSLALTTGILIINQSNFSIMGNIASGNGTLSTSSNDNLTINTSTSLTGGLQFASGSTVNNLTINILDGGTVSFNSGLLVNGTLTLTKGHINIGSNNLQIAATGSITGASSSAYIITAMGGSLTLALTAGSTSAMTFPIGTSSNYFPAAISLNTGSNSGNVGVGVYPHVYAHGTAGTVISATQHAVDGTWDIQTNFTTNLNMNIELMWQTTAEVNGFDRNNAYISHYINGSWDFTATGSAIAEANGMYGLKKSNITSLSPFAVFDKSTTTGVDNNKTAQANAGFETYPNPVTDRITVINPSDAGQLQYAEICDINGQIITRFQLNNASTSFDLSALKKGCYFIRIYDEKSSTTKQFIKM
jgi:hypothetical protein